MLPTILSYYIRILRVLFLCWCFHFVMSRQNVYNFIYWAILIKRWRWFSCMPTPWMLFYSIFLSWSLFWWWLLCKHYQRNGHKCIDNSITITISAYHNKVHKSWSLIYLFIIDNTCATNKENQSAVYTPF